MNETEVKTNRTERSELPLKEDKKALDGISLDRIMDFTKGQEAPTLESSPDFIKHVPLALFPKEVPILLEGEWMTPVMITQVDQNGSLVSVSAEISRKKWMSKRE